MTGFRRRRWMPATEGAALLQTLGRPEDDRRTAVYPSDRRTADATAAPASLAVASRLDSAAREGEISSSCRAALGHVAHCLPPPFVPLARYFILRPLRPGLAAALHNGVNVAVAANAMRPLRLPGAVAFPASDTCARRVGERP